MRGDWKPGVADAVSFGGGRCRRRRRAHRAVFAFTDGMEDDEDSARKWQNINIYLGYIRHASRLCSSHQSRPDWDLLNASCQVRILVWRVGEHRVLFSPFSVAKRHRFWASFHPSPHQISFPSSLRFFLSIQIPLTPRISILSLSRSSIQEIRVF